MLLLYKHAPNLFHAFVNLLCEDADGIVSVESLEFNLNSIRVATENFSDANKLGQGGFGIVYKVKKKPYIWKRKTILVWTLELVWRWSKLLHNLCDVFLGYASQWTDIAVKRLSRDSGQGELEFKMRSY